MLKFILSTETLNLEFAIALALLLLASETERNNSGVRLVQEFKVSSFSIFSLKKLVNMHSMLKEMLQNYNFGLLTFILNAIIYLFTTYKERIDNRNANKQLFH